MNPPSTKKINLFAGIFQKIVKKFLPSILDYKFLATTIDTAKETGVISTDVNAMISGVMEISNLDVSEIMIPRSMIRFVHSDWTIDQILTESIYSGHSRYPVQDNEEQVIGVLIVKDLIKYLVDNSKESFELKDHIRKVLIAPYTKPVNAMLQEFKSEHFHIAIVVNEYGETDGLITIEDIIEQIVGDITDEHDAVKIMIKQISKNGYRAEAIVSLEEFNETLGTALVNDEVETLGGYLVQHLSRVPERNENIQIGNLQFRIMNGDTRRIHTVRVRILNDALINNNDDDAK